MNTREFHRGLDAHCDRRVQAASFPLRGLKLHENRSEPLRQVVVNVAGEAVSLLEDPFSALLAPIEVDEAAVVQSQGGLTGDRLDQHDAPPPALGV